MSQAEETVSRFATRKPRSFSRKSTFAMASHRCGQTFADVLVLAREFWLNPCKNTDKKSPRGLEADSADAKGIGSWAEFELKATKWPASQSSGRQDQDCSGSHSGSVWMAKRSILAMIDLPPWNCSIVSERILLGLTARKGLSECLRNVTQWIRSFPSCVKPMWNLVRARRCPSLQIARSR